MEVTLNSGMDTRLHLWSKLRRGIVFTEGVVRYVRTARIGATTFLDYWWSLRSLDEESAPYEVAILKCHKRAATRIYKGALKNGGIYIKFGQALATLNHVLPREFTEKLALLQDQVPKRGYKEVETLFLEDFGRTPLQIFKEFDLLPVAAASLAQVHTARTADGKKVAVKVQYMDLRDRFHGDMETIRIIVRGMDWVFGQRDRVRIFDEIKKNLKEELDFEKEARNSEKCQEGLRLLGYVYVPKVFWKYTSKRVLTMEYIEGVKPTDLEELERHNFNRKEVAHKVVETFNHQIFHTGFIHADPHPGNIFIRSDTKGQVQVVLLDHGLYTEVDTNTRVAFGKFWKNLILRNESGIQESCRDLGIKEYELFTMLLTGKVLKRHLSHQNVSSDISKEDVAQIKEYMSNNEDKFEDIFQSLPPATFLMFRNINIIRSINKHLGTPVNRFLLMARSAATGSETHSYAGIWLLWNTAIFDIRLRIWSFKMWLFVAYLKVLVALGRVPPEATQRIQQMQA
ncbi:aarF domain-containing protein kinase 5-like isoform X2 [Oopsacas minuta]|uniref:AarF domain-containing protein kinase 5-like isoform X2 n=1 Tax=Oopsacas minuta TaxID=111878 RepID=A0AAV7KEB1_9METZ|nr:aarF domain-containing protein kinase 5-like isoform X2 [Oopsacas minuta]